MYNICFAAQLPNRFRLRMEKVGVGKSGILMLSEHGFGKYYPILRHVGKSVERVQMNTFKPQIEPEAYYFENHFYLTCGHPRIWKALAQYELYKQITGLPGHVIECGVYKGSSFVRLCAYRDALESSDSRTVVGFDAFGDFPIPSDSNDEDRKFANEFTRAAGFGISKGELEDVLNKKSVRNFALIKGDIAQTIPEYILSHSQLRIALLHIDVDLYHPTMLVLEEFFDRVVSGGIIMLDDYAIVDGATRATDDFLQQHDLGRKVEKSSISHVPCYIKK